MNDESKPPRAILERLVLPSTISRFEANYLARLNAITFWFFAAHVPALTLIAALNGTRPLLALVLSLAVLAGPLLAWRTLGNPRAVSIVYGVAAMFFGGLLVHFGQGPMQIEMHFYFFALIAMCAVFGNPMVIIAATVTVALHHLVVWLALPRSVFNYDASVWVVVVHAAFVVLEAVATVFIARSFFDNVIGLERKVQARTAQLDEANRSMRALLDAVDQGFLTVDRSLCVRGECSAQVARWIGAVADGDLWSDHLAGFSPEFALQTALAFEQLTEGLLPAEVAIEQMPRRVVIGARHLDVAYRPIGDPETFERCLVVLTDVTADLAQEAAERDKRELVAVVSRMLADRVGFGTFFDEAGRIVADLHARTGTLADRRRALHTLKGNAGIFGLASVAAICHRIEDLGSVEREWPEEAMLPLVDRWARIAEEVARIGGTQVGRIEVTEADLVAIENAARAGSPAPKLARMIRDLRNEPTARRLSHLGEQAERLARQLEREELVLEIDDGGVRLPPKRWGPFWSAFVHAVRNAVDHGIEPAAERLAAGKPASGTLRLETKQTKHALLVQIEDDGRGIAWERIAERARARGIPVETPEQLRAAVFCDGVSSKDVATDLSGRGIGMGALLAAVSDLGGTIDLESVPGFGTCLRIAFPNDRVDSLSPAA